MAGHSRAGSAAPLSWTVAFVVTLTALLIAALFPVVPSRLTVKAGNIASHTIRAPRELSYSSDELRRQLQDQRRASVQSVFVYDVNAKSLQKAKLQDIIRRINSQRDTIGLTRSAQAEGIRRIPNLNLRAEQIDQILDMTPDGWSRTEEEANRLLGLVLEDPFPSSELENRKASVPNRVLDGTPAIHGAIAAALVQPLVVPTQREDEAETQRRKDQAAAAVEPQMQGYAKNQVIVREGDVIDAAAIEALKSAGLLDFHLNLPDLASVIVIAVLCAGLLGCYIQAFRPPALNRFRRLMAAAFLIAGLVLAAKLYLPLVLPDTDRRFLAYVLPVAAVPMLIAVLFEAPFALMVAAVVTVLTTFTAIYLPDVSGIVSLSAVQPLQMSAAYLFGGLAGVLVVQRAERLNHYFLAGVAVMVASFVSLFAFWFLDGSRRPLDLAWMGGASVIAGGLSAALCVGIFATLGSVFGVTTRLQLMELAQLNAPLLRRLQDEAPGTFHHSIIVGNLAERAADLIGADSLLVRVGSYYHDIGKMARPGFFIENQLSGSNPHDGLDPLTSAEILHEHVRHGSELARRHHLPERVAAFIPEHHGTRLVAYFYRKAAQVEPRTDPSQFTYDGPRPQSRETAIVMLADSTEAMVRAATDRSQERIEAMVEAVIAERLAEGQFDDCDLTLRDLRVIAESFKKSMRAIYHPRVEYPAPTLVEEQRRRAAALPPASQGRLTLMTPPPPFSPAAEPPAAADSTGAAIGHDSDGSAATPGSVAGSRA